MPAPTLDGVGSSNQDTLPKIANSKYITVGIPFRPDGKGDAHRYDRSAIEALNQLRLEFTVLVKTLPLGAQGESVSRSMLKEDIQRDLEDVDLLYIPGGPNALEIQEATTAEILDPKKAKEEEQFKKTSTRLEAAKARVSAIRGTLETLTGKKLSTAQQELKNAVEALNNAERLDTEYRSRDAYETRLIEIAKTRGMMILAVCAGSWRLLKTYGGSVRALPISDRAKHAAESGNPWSLSHDIEVQKDSMLHTCVLKPKDQDLKPSMRSIVTDVNTTHWAVVIVDPNNPNIPAIKSFVHTDGRKLNGLQEGTPSLLKINAVAKS